MKKAFALLLCIMAYHHFPDQAQFRREAMRVLKPGRSLYLCDPRFPRPVRWFFNTFFRGAGFYSPDQCVRDFEGEGFRNVSILKDAYVQVLRFDSPLPPH